MELGQAHSERETEKALIAKVKALLRPMGMRKNGTPNCIRQTWLHRKPMPSTTRRTKQPQAALFALFALLLFACCHVDSQHEASSQSDLRCLKVWLNDLLRNQLCSSFARNCSSAQQTISECICAVKTEKPIPLSQQKSTHLSKWQSLGNEPTLARPHFPTTYSRRWPNLNHSRRYD